jgi:hypothetical protein
MRAQAPPWAAPASRHLVAPLEADQKRVDEPALPAPGFTRESLGRVESTGAGRDGSCVLWDQRCSDQRDLIAIRPERQPVCPPAPKAAGPAHAIEKSTAFLRWGL